MKEKLSGFGALFDRKSYSQLVSKGVESNFQ